METVFRGVGKLGVDKNQLRSCFFISSIRRSWWATLRDKRLVSKQINQRMPPAFKLFQRRHQGGAL